MGSRTVPAVFERGSPSTTASAVRTPRPRPRKRAAVALELERAERLLLERDQVGEPHPGLVRRARPPGRQQGPEPGHELRLHEEVGECGMRLVGGLRRQHDLGIGGDIDLTGPVLEIGDRQPAKLGVVLRGDHDLEGGRQRPVPLHDLGPVLGVDHVVGVRLGPAGLEAGRPDVTAVRVPQVDERAPAVTGRVLPPARHGQVAPPAEAGAGGGDHDGVAAVGQEMGARRDVVRRFEAAQRRRDEAANERGLPHLLGPGPRHRHRARRPLLEEEFGGLDQRLGVKAPPGHAVVNHVPQGDDGHSLVVGHVGPDHGHPVALRQPRRRVVEGLVEAVRAPGPGLLEADEVLHRVLWVDHGREGGGVGRDDHVLAEPPLESQTGNAEIRVLIRQVHVANVVGRLGDPPRDLAVLAVPDLIPHHQPAGEVEQAVGGLPHHEQRHQVLEHRPRPGDEGRAAAHRRQRPAEPEPVPG